MKKPKKTFEDIGKIASYIPKIDDLSPYMYRLSSLAIEELASSLKLEEFNDLETIFLQGDSSLKLYIILKGHVWLYDRDEFGCNVLVTTVGYGKILGERGLIRNLPRSLTAISKKHTYLISIDFQKFKSLLNSQMHLSIEEKVTFLNRRFPKSNGFKLYQKEKLAYCIDIKTHNQGDIILHEGRIIDYVIVVHTGECILLKTLNFKTIKVSYIGPGCMVAEESFFRGEPSHFTYKVISETAKLYYIKKEHFYTQSPKDLIKKLSKICNTRVRQRDRIVEAAIRFSPNNSCDGSIQNTSFQLANPIAREKLMGFAKGFRNQSEKSLNQSKEYTLSKEKLIKLRERIKLSKPIAFSESSIFLSRSFII